MDIKDLVEIGYTKKPHGLNGEIKIQVKDKYLEDFLRSNCVFLDLNGSIIPHFIVDIRNTKHILAQFEDVDSIGEAEKIAGKKILLRSKDLIPEEEKILELDVLEFAFAEGFMVQDVNLGDLGKILSVEEFPQQEMAFVDYKGKEILIPMIDAFIIEIDKKGNRILVELPEGLV